MKTFNTKRKAFTLIELLIVIAIIGILFIVLVSKVDFATDKAKATGVQTDFRSFQVAIESVAKEHAGLATFGWDTGDTNGNRIRDSYDKGDTNKNGKQDPGEIFVGSKTYGETWTNVYTLTNPADADDKSAIVALEEAINKNLDPKLHITIADDLTITMANGAQDPWNTEYHGYYITNATTDGKDRGAIVMYSNGANQEFGSEHSIAGGVVTVNVPGNNVYGKDDYGMSVIYTYVNGYGEIKTTTSGFSINQGDANNSGMPGEYTPGGEVPTPGDPIDPQPGGEGTNSLPKPNLDGTVANATSPFAYKWSELKELAHANLSADELRDTYGIEVGDYKEVDGVKYVLVDLGTDNDHDGIREAGEDYDGFVFMYNSGATSLLNSTPTNKGGYVSTDVGKAYVDSLYTNLTDADLKNSIKKVTIICNSGDLAANGADTNGMSKYITDAYMFLASTKEIGCNLSGYQYDAEGSVFDYFAAGTDTVRKDFGTLVNIPGYSAWRLRSADSDSIQDFHGVYCTWGNCGGGTASCASVIVPVFVIGEQIPIEVVPTPEPDPEPTPEPELTPEPITYSWSELKTLAQKNLSADELRDTYGIEVGDYKEVDGVKYILVDLDGNDYDGFVFMYNSGTKSKLNSTSTNQGGYASTDIGKAYVDSLYTNLADADLKNSIKEVTITCNDGADNINETHEYTTHMFLASYREVGYTSRLNSTMYGPGLSAEGKCFDLFTDDNSSRTTFMSMANISDRWWVRSAFAGSTTYFCNVYKFGSCDNFFADSTYVIVPAFVIG